MKTIQKMWSSLATPALLLDKSAMERNAQTMLRRAAELGVALRPNVKTHKSVEVAQLQHTGVWSDANNNNKTDRSAMRVCTSTLLETRHFLQHGFGDVLYAVPLAGASKVAIAQELLVQFGARVAFMVDTVEAVAALPAIDAKWPLFVKVDCGYGRAGRSGEALRQVVEAVQNAKLRCVLRGLYTHAGHSYKCCDAPSLEHQAAAEARAMIKEHDLVGQGVITSIGATPTASRPASKEEYRHIDEIHPGNYVFYDAMQCQIGSCSLEEVACTVLATVIGVYPERGSALCDAGSRALGKDALELPSPSPWGVVLGLENVNLVSISQEVGILKGNGVSKLHVGQVIRIVPNHSCLTATNFSTYHVIDGDAVVTSVTPCPRGFH